MLTANRIFLFFCIFLISSSLAISPILSSPVFYLSQKGPNVAFAQTDKSGDQPSFSFSLGPNVAFAQSDKGGDQPSASFSLTVISGGTSCDDPSPDPVNAGTNQGDTIYGTPDADITIDGGEGKDFLFGCAGGDRLDGGPGKDTLDGGPGDDTLIGGNGGESLTGGPGADTFNCGHAKDTVEDYTPSEGDILIDCENAIIPDNTPPVLTGPD